MVVLEDLPLGRGQSNCVGAISVGLGVWCRFDSFETVVLDDDGPEVCRYEQHKLTTFGKIVFSTSKFIFQIGALSSKNIGMGKEM